MEAFGILGEIQVTSEVFHRIQCGYLFKERGPIYIKGKGEMPVYILVGKKKQIHELRATYKELQVSHMAGSQ